MGTNSFLRFEPQQLNFQFEVNKQLSTSIRLFNDTHNHVAFKLKTTNPNNYGVQPRIGIIYPGSSCQITVKRRAVRKVPPNMRCKDKFMIQSLIANSAATTPHHAQNLFNEESAHLVQECKLPVVYNLPALPPQVNSPAIDNSTESSLVTSEVTHSVVETQNNVLQTNLRKLLNVQPAELRFPYVKLKKELSCPLQLSNTTEDHVAFMVNIPNLKYSVQPSCGIVLPQSTLNVTVRLQEQNNVPSIVQGEDKVLIQSAIASSSLTTEDIIPDMFGKSGTVVEECEVQVVKILEDKNRIHTGELIMRGIIISLLGFVSWYLMKQTISIIWSLTMVIIMLMIKMIKKLVSESLEDWIVKTLLYIFMHLLLKCKETLRLS